MLFGQAEIIPVESADLPVKSDQSAPVSNVGNSSISSSAASARTRSVGPIHWPPSSTTIPFEKCGSESGPPPAPRRPLGARPRTTVTRVHH